jgi:hypothetical protein
LRKSRAISRPPTQILALLVPREMKVEHSGGVKAMTDE